MVCVFLQVVRLPQPVFLPNYCEYEWNDGEGEPRIEFPIRYVSDVWDTRSLSWIEFDSELPMQSYIADYSSRDGWRFMTADSQGETVPGEVAGRYRIRTVYCSIVPDWPKGQAPEEIVLTRASIGLEGEPEQTVEAELGTIVLKPRPADSHENGVFVSASGGSSSDGTSFDEYRLVKGVTFSGIESRFEEAAKGLFRLEINGAPLDQMVGCYVAPANSLRFDLDFPPPDDPTAKLTRFLFDINLNYTCEDGTKGFLPVRISYGYDLDADFGDLWRYLKESGVK